MPRPRFDAVFLDFYGTVSAGDRQAVQAACRALVEAFGLTLSPDELAISWGEQFFKVVDASNHESFRSLYECECLSLKQTIGPVVGPFDPAPFVEVLEAYWRNPPVHQDAVDLLKSINLPICCVSNADAAPLASAISQNGLRFDAVVSSQEARCYKPNAGIFQKAAQVLNVVPERVLHIGDSLHSDVRGAAQLGITTAWLCRTERIHDIGTANADHIVRSLTEVPELFHIKGGRWMAP